MYLFLIILYALICVFLISVILLQAGRGGGLAEAFGGTESVLGSQAPVILKRMTEIGAALFIILSLVLAIMTSKRSTSLVDQVRGPLGPLSRTAATAAPVAPVVPAAGTQSQAPAQAVSESQSETEKAPLAVME